MYKNCRTPQSARRQQSMEQGLLRAMARQRYEEITVSALCRQMEIPRKAFYRYFDSLDDALYALLDHSLLECDRAMLYTGRLLPVRELERFFRFWQEHAPLLDALARSGLSSRLIERALVYNTEHPHSQLTADAREGEPAATVLVLFVMLQWHHGGCRRSPAEMAQSTAQLLSHPLLDTE